MKFILAVVVAHIKGFDLDDGTNLLQTSIGKHRYAEHSPNGNKLANSMIPFGADIANFPQTDWIDHNKNKLYKSAFGDNGAPKIDVDFDQSRWVQLDGYYPLEGSNSDMDQLYGSLKECMDKCDEAGDCKAVTTKSGYEWRVSRQALGAWPVLYRNDQWEQVGYQRSWIMIKAATPPSGSISVSSATCGDKDMSAAVAQSCKGKTDCVITLAAGEETNPATPTFVGNWTDIVHKPIIVGSQTGGDFDFDRSRWVQLDGYMVSEGHGNYDQCYPTVREAMEKCAESGTCKAVAFQTLPNCKYRVSHQALGAAPTLVPAGPQWPILGPLRCWVSDSPGVQSCKDAYSVTYSCSSTDERKAYISSPSEGKTVALSCATTKTTTAATTSTITSGTTSAITTTIPGGNTNVDGKNCFGAIETFGPDFDCNAEVSSFCADDSADGLDVSACCQDYCNSNQEKRSKKKESEASRKEAEGERKSKRRESRSKRKDAESERKKKRKEEEWLAKRNAQETSNKREEDERKTKRGYSESKRKNERSWKANRAQAKKAAQLREAARKAGRANSGNESKKKKKQAEIKQKKKASWKAQIEKRRKKNSKNGRKGR